MYWGQCCCEFIEGYLWVMKVVIVYVENKWCVVLVEIKEGWFDYVVYFLNLFRVFQYSGYGGDLKRCMVVEGVKKWLVVQDVKKVVSIVRNYWYKLNYVIWKWLVECIVDFMKFDFELFQGELLVVGLVLKIVNDIFMVV